MEERNSRYELQPARNGLTVPVINGVYLHSIYNPSKEAIAFGQANEKNLTHKNKVLILGLGFGYHVEEIAKILNRNHKSYEIVILEPNEKLVNDFITTRNFEDKNIKIICAQKVRDLFEDWNFINFLMSKPCIIKHDTSFILEKNFFTGFLAYQAPKDILNYRRLLSPASQELFNENTQRDLTSHIQAIKDTGKIQGKSQYMLLAFDKISKINTQGIEE